MYILDLGSGFFYPGSRGEKRHQIPDRDTQHRIHNEYTIFNPKIVQSSEISCGMLISDLVSRTELFSPWIPGPKKQKVLDPGSGSETLVKQKNV
jgi:hypothetical protein